MNYRSVVVLATATEIIDADDKAAALDAFVEHIVPGRTAGARAATPLEIKGTKVLAVPLDEASLKLRTGPPVDDDDDLGLPVWAGVMRLAMVPGSLVPDELLDPSIPVPGYLRRSR